MTGTARSVRLAVGLAAAALVAGCATLNVNSYVERGLDFSRYISYSLESPGAFATGDPRLDNNVFFQDHLQGAIGRELNARGFMAVDSRPDLLVHYHASVRKDVDINGADRKKGYEIGYSGSEADARPFVFDEGTLTIDIIDARTNRLVWRGWAERSLDGAINDQAWLQRRIEDTITRIFDKMPGKL
jgi:hypothetical protein